MPFGKNRMSITQPSGKKIADLRTAATIGTRAHRPWRRMLRRAFWLILMFVVGAIAGGAGTTILIERMRSEILKHPEKLADRLMMTIRHDAGSSLTVSQDRVIREIIDRHHDRFMKLHNEFHPQVMSEIDALESDVAAALTEEQRKLWLPRFRFVRERMMP